MLPAPSTVAPAPPRDEPWSRRTAGAVSLSLAAAALAVRLLARPGRPMWFDECFSVAVARLEPRLLLEQVTGPSVNFGLQSVLLAAVLRVTDRLGTDVLLAARALSVACGVVTVPALFLLGRRALGDRPALVAAGLLATSRAHVYYSLEARQYALAILLVVLSSLALLALLDSPGPGPALAFGALAVLATWAHLFAAFVLAAQALAIPFHARFRPARRWLAAGLAVAGLGSAAVVAQATRQDPSAVAWIAPLSWDQVGGVFVGLAGGARLLFVPAAAGAVAAAAIVRGGGPRRFGAALALAWTLVPIALAVGVSAVRPLLVPRYLLVALPGFVLLVALGVDALRRPRAVAVAAALVAALSLREVVRDRRADPPWQPVDTVAARIVRLARPGDALVVSHPALAVSLDRELGRLGARGPERVDPVPGDPLSLGRDARPPLADRLARRSAVLFVLCVEQPDSAAARAALAPSTRVTDDEELGGVRLLRLERLAR